MGFEPQPKMGSDLAHFLIGLTLLLIGLKLTRSIATDWWIVLMPIYAPSILTVLWRALTKGSIAGRK